MKISKKIKSSKILNNNWFLLIIIFFLFICLLVILNPEIIKAPYMFLEDGSIFTKQYMEYGFGSFKLTYGGYFDTLSRIFAFIAVNFAKLTNSAVVLANTFKWLSILFSAFVATYFTSSSFENIIKSRGKRVIISALVIILISNFAWLLYNGVAIHWWCGLLIFLVSLNLLHDKMPSYVILPLVLISIISSASSLILGFALMYYILEKIGFIKYLRGGGCIKLKNFGKHNLIKLILMGLFLLIQAYAILFITDVETLVKIDLSLGHLISVAYYSLLLLISSINMVFGTDTFSALCVAKLNIFTGSILWLIIIGMFYKTKNLKTCILVILDIFILYFMMNFKRVDFIAYFLEITSGISYQIWYHVLPATFVFLGIAISLSNISLVNQTFKSIEIGFLIFALFFFVRNINHPEFETSQKIFEIEPYVDYKNKKYANIQISPPHMNVTVPIPVSNDYCQNHECFDEIK